MLTIYNTHAGFVLCLVRCPPVMWAQATFHLLQGVLNPLVERRAGDWYPARYVTGSNMRGVYGYRVSF